MTILPQIAALRHEICVGRSEHLQSLSVLVLAAPAIAIPRYDKRRSIGLNVKSRSSLSSRWELASNEKSVELGGPANMTRE
jgi:hypothetical protein